MPNPFENEDGSFVILKNEEGQHSLWPEFVPSPLGWQRVYGPAGRRDCLEYVEGNWRDLRPASLIKASTI